MSEWDSITNIDVYKTIIATVVMTIAGVVIFFRRRWMEHKKNSEK